MRNFNELPPLGLYIHLPWCIKKCPYCDFNSHATKNLQIPEEQYIDALLADLTMELPDFWGRGVSSIFIGGGTPSLFSPESLDRLLSGIRALTNIPSLIEITMEANPGTFEQGKFNEFRSLGINRLSIGVQSFNNNHLKLLGRIHDRDEAIKSVEIARQAGFKRLNLDLMHGLPEQNVNHSKQDLTQAIDLQPDHISWYQLTIEPNTLFSAQPPPVPNDDTLWDIQICGQDILQTAGFNQYEVSAYSKEKQQCKHNLNYWTFGDYLGIGSGAHGKISFASNGKIIRRSKLRHPQSFIESSAGLDRISQESEISINETGVEFMMNALRLREGVPTSTFQQHTGLPIGVISAQLKLAQDKGLMEVSHDRLVTSKLGFSHLNSVLDIFMQDNRKSIYVPIVAE